MKYNPAKPFTNIAISLSGGGYRATAYHLGVLSLLDEIKFSYSTSNEEEKSLLEKVTVLSTVSGGTILGARYAIDAADSNKKFKDTYSKIFELLDKDSLMEDAFHKFDPKSKWVAPHRNTNLINAFAEVYHEKFFDQKTFKDIFHDPKKDFNNKSHLKEIIFNATEFANSLHFRFQTGGNFGNGKIEFPMEVAAEIRIADAVACSSCFPSGFEPIEIPRDISNGPDSSVQKFWNTKINQEEEKDKEEDPSEKENNGKKGKYKYPKKMAVMDGGIVDNQGIDSVDLAEGRNNSTDGNKKRNHYIGTFIVSDVTQELNAYKVINPIQENSKWSIDFLNKVILIIGLLIGGVLLFSFYQGWNNIWMGIGLFLVFIIASYLIFFNRVWSSLKNKFSHELGQKKLDSLSNLNILKIIPIQLLKFLISYRVSTTVHMTGSVFMKRIRDLQVKMKKKDKYWKYRFKTNNIYSLLHQPKEYLGELIPPIIKDANSMETTLWFTELQKQPERRSGETDHNYEEGKDMLKKLITCGQITICHNLLEYLERVKSQPEFEKLTDTEQEDLIGLENRLKDMFLKFVKTPYWLYDAKAKLLG